MKHTMKALLTAVLVTFISQLVQADDFDDTRKVFENAGERQAYFARYRSINGMLGVTGRPENSLGS